MKKVVIPIVLLVIAIPVAMYFLGYFPGTESSEHSSEEAVKVDSHGNVIEESDAYYLPLDPPFVVNFSHLGTLRYLQISLEVMYPEEEQLDKATEKMPVIRNALILLLSDQEYEKLNTKEGKEELRKEMMIAVNDIVMPEKDIHENDSHEMGEIYITSFVMQ